MKIVTPRERLYIAQYHPVLPDRSPGRYTFYGIVVALYLPDDIPEEDIQHMANNIGDGYDELPYYALDEVGQIYVIRTLKFQLVSQTVIDEFEELKLPLDLA